MATQRMPGRHLVHFYMKNPNERGPVELLLLEVGRLWRESGGSISSYFIADPPGWYTELLEQAGITFGTMNAVDQRPWNSEVARIGELERPDLAHIHFGWHKSAALLKRHGAVVLRTEHSGRFPKRLEPLRRVVRHVQQRPLAGFIAVADFVNIQTQRDFLVPADKVRTVHNGVDLTWFHPRAQERPELRERLFGISDDRVVITQAAFLDGRKRQAMLIRAMPAVLTAAPNTHLVLAGGGDDEALLRQLVTDLGLHEQVSLLTGDNNVAEIYAASDIAALVSSMEGLPGSAIEALATGLPLLIAPNGGSVEVVEDEISGIYLHDQTSEGTAGALIKLVLDADLRHRLGKAALARAEDIFDIRVAAAKTVAYYDELLPRHP